MSPSPTTRAAGGPGPGPGERVLRRLKTRGPATAAELARGLGVTPEAVRQSLVRLSERGLVREHDAPRAEGRAGRPARRWRLGEAAAARFPDAHAELAVELLDTLREAFGEDGLERLVVERTRRKADAYRAADGSLAGSPRRGARGARRPPLARRVAALARLRTREGYMARWRRRPDGSFLLVEDHCPVCAAARACSGLCRGELELFRDVLGARVERTEHLLEGGRRCVYRISE